ncbi:polysaccharide biosynthesis/export family protein [Mucilaginibacter jinjuensis]|uniref:Polysaccharide export protein n=1 Tax=Mucilaginibacter jinjuensis TaxID=1176721 RepID=A0ABY7TDW8_9SPHI|nr:polysaccharide biosynthesis/export family protein [Mucilaginibacter jinjuensis]WCT13827.1 polysaccharide export protein [Mucilaginibacter jinjuensis]
MHILKSSKIAGYLILVAITISSCFNEKKITYFQKGAQGGKDTISVAQMYVPKIAEGDILSIYINSLSIEASSFFNPYSASTTSSESSSSGTGSPGLSQTASPGFLVDVNGNITLPILGEVPVRGLTIVDAQNVIKKRVAVYLKDPTVSVRFLNYRVSVLGEVNKPGVYVIPNESTTLPEAITMAGDLTTFAKRNDIQIIRDVDGKKEFGEIDFTTRDVFSSKYYYLHANDIIYVKAGKSKVAQSDITLRILPLVIAALSVIIVLIK